MVSISVFLLFFADIRTKVRLRLALMELPQYHLQVASQPLRKRVGEPDDREKCVYFTSCRWCLVAILNRPSKIYNRFVCSDSTEVELNSLDVEPNPRELEQQVDAECQPLSHSATSVTRR